MKGFAASWLRRSRHTKMRANVPAPTNRLRSLNLGVSCAPAGSSLSASLVTWWSPRILHAPAAYVSNEVRRKSARRDCRCLAAQYPLQETCSKTSPGGAVESVAGQCGARLPIWSPPFGPKVQSSKLASCHRNPKSKTQPCRTKRKTALPTSRSNSVSFPWEGLYTS